MLLLNKIVVTFYKQISIFFQKYTNCFSKWIFPMKVKRFGKNLIFVAQIMVAVLICVYMWGCSDDVSMHWSEERLLGS